GSPGPEVAGYQCRFLGRTKGGHHPQLGLGAGDGCPWGKRPTRTPAARTCFEIHNDLLYWVVQEPQMQEELRQLLVPWRFRWDLLHLAHSVPWAGHLGREKTLQQVAQRFFWPGIHQEVRDYCASCPKCWKASPKRVPKVPLVPLAVIGMPFNWIGLDLVGPLERSSSGHKYILVVVDYATRYPEAGPLRAATAPIIANELLHIFMGQSDSALTFAR
uniref:Gypsy retrotransposon integrase-like protein 1 n=1 Tax=Terrapene triunguis TaxID=2587831 RepID=A0A674K1E4_9SAUR